MYLPGGRSVQKSWTLLTRVILLYRYVHIYEGEHPLVAAEVLLTDFYVYEKKEEKKEKKQK